MSIVVQQLTHIHTDREILFQDISFSIQRGEKVGIVGNNGSGKSSLLRLVSGYSTQAKGTIHTQSAPYYIPQHYGQYDEMDVAQALQIGKKINALQAILSGDVSTMNMDSLNDDWQIEERVVEALLYWNLAHVTVNTQLSTLSGGEKTKIFLAGIAIHNPQIILMDEPSNHLDIESRAKLYELIEDSFATIVIVSHDRTLLNQMSSIYELSHLGMTLYGGNYNFYKEQKAIQSNALIAQKESKEKEIRTTRRQQQEVAERKQKHESRGKKLSEKKGIGKMAMDTLQDRAEKSASKLKDMHREKLEKLSSSISEIQAEINVSKEMKIDFNSSDLHLGKILISAKNVNFAYKEDNPVWQKPLNLKIRSGDRILIKGANGSGKTTLLKLITKELAPTAGELQTVDYSYVYLDQEYSMIQNELSVYDQVQQYNNVEMPEHIVKMTLARSLFNYSTWDKPCSVLSGGEKMRLVLCCLIVGTCTPDIIILDEPTNNIDVKNIEVLTNSIKDYKGTVLLVSHDESFIHDVGVGEVLELGDTGKSNSIS